MPKTSLKSIIFSWLGNLLTFICFETYPLIDHIKDRIKIAIIIFLNRRKGLNLKRERENELWVKFLFPIIVHYKTAIEFLSRVKLGVLFSPSFFVTCVFQGYANLRNQLIELFNLPLLYCAFRDVVWNCAFKWFKLLFLLCNWLW